MRLLRINDTEVDIDDNTAIGITLQSYDVKQPGKRFVNITNSFTVPATSKNLAIFGFANDPQSTSKKVYEASTVDYFVDNEHYIANGKIRVDGITDRIELFIFEKPSVWDQIKLVKWPDFVADFIPWLQENKGLPSRANQFSGNFGEFLQPCIEASEGVILPFYFGNLYDHVVDGAFIEDASNIYLRSWPVDGIKADGGHFSVFIKSVFEYIEYVYDVNFLTDGGQAVGNLWDDPIAQSMYTPFRDITVRNNIAGDSFYFEVDTDSQFLPLKDVKDKAGKTLHDLVNSFFQKFNVIKDDLLIDNQRVIRLARFDDLEALAEVKDFSGGFDGVPKFIPFVKGYAQENIIKSKEVFPEGDALVNSRVLTSLNENLNASAPLFEIDEYIPSFININAVDAIPYLTVKESFKTFQFFVNDGLSLDIINIHTEESGNRQTATFKMQKAAIYSLDGEYTMLDDIIKYPRVYEWRKWLSPFDIRNFEFFKLYYIVELGGSYFMNKISGFNPDKSNAPTKLELIKVSNRTPIWPTDLEYWTDGIGDPWADGVSDIFY